MVWDPGRFAMGQGKIKERHFLLPLTSKDAFWKVLSGLPGALNRGGAPAPLSTVGRSRQPAASRGLGGCGTRA